MSLTRRTMLRAAGALPLLADNLSFSALAQTAPTPPVANEIPPVLFVHGNGDHAALWITTLWRMESNGGKEPKDVKPGVPTDSTATLRLAAEEVTGRRQRHSIQSESWRGPGQPRKTGLRWLN
jgi:hypothetical protein